MVTMRNLVRFSALALLASSVPALACANHDEAAYGFLGTLNLGGMTPEEIEAKKQEAIDAYHARELARARARFVRRFDVDPAPREPQLASAASAAGQSQR